MGFRPRTEQEAKLLDEAASVSAPLLCSEEEYASGFLYYSRAQRPQLEEEMSSEEATKTLKLQWDKLVPGTGCKDASSLNKNHQKYWAALESLARAPSAQSKSSKKCKERHSKIKGDNPSGSRITTYFSESASSD